MKKKRLQYADEGLDKKNPMLAMEAWIGRHWKQVLFVCFGLVFVTVVYAMHNVSNLKDAVKLQAKAIDSLAKRVIIAAPDGRVTIVQTADVSDPYIVFVLKDIISKYLLWGALEISTITKNDVNAFTKSEKVQNFLRFCRTEASKKKYQAYLESVWNSYVDGTLPEVVYITGFSNENFKVQNDLFYYSVNVSLNAYRVEQGKWISGTISLNIALKGKIDLQRSEPYNPWGIFFEDFDVSVLKMS